MEIFFNSKVLQGLWLSKGVIFLECVPLIDKQNASVWIYFATSQEGYYEICYFAFGPGQKQIGNFLVFVKVNIVKIHGLSVFLSFSGSYLRRLIHWEFVGLYVILPGFVSFWGVSAGAYLQGWDGALSLIFTVSHIMILLESLVS